MNEPRGRRISKAPLEPHETVQLDWSRQLSQALGSYNVQVDDYEDNLGNVNISESEGIREVRRPEIEDLDITAPLKMKQANIGTEEEPKNAMLGNYWDDATVANVIELLREYRDFFPTKIMELKGILGDLGMMKITLNLDAKPAKQRPYRLNPKYKAKVHKELDKMLAVGIIELVEESDWVNPMVV